MHSKPIEQWSVDEVAIWLLCIGLGEKVERFKENEVAGTELSDLTSEELTDGLGLDHLQAKKLILSRDFTKSVSNLERLAAEMKTVELEKAGLEDQLVAKNETIRQLENQPEGGPEAHHDWHPEDEVMSLEHRHQAERRRMEERQEAEMHREEILIQERRGAGADEASQTEKSAHKGKRHFKVQPYDPHRLF